MYQNSEPYKVALFGGEGWDEGFLWTLSMRFLVVVQLWHKFVLQDFGNSYRFFLTRCFSPTKSVSEFFLTLFSTNSLRYCQQILERMNLEGFNLSNVCRLCLRSSKDLKNIFAKELVDEQPKMNLAARITACVALEILPTDRGPHTICDKCLESVNNWYEFNEVCHVSNALLSKYLTVAPDSGKRNTNQISEKQSILNENSLLPEISIMSHDSLLDRSFGLESNTSIRDFCISPTPFGLDHFLSDTPLEIPSGSTSFANIIPCSSPKAASVPKETPKSTATESKKRYSCEFCHLVFPKFVSLLSHDRQEHISMAKQSCSVCGRLFVSADRLKTHSELAHREKSFRCDVCDKMFSSHKSLKVHQRLHSDQYQCKLCDFASTSKLYLEQHAKKHEGGAEVFACSSCDKRFSYRSALLRHENVHSADKGKVFRCPVCQSTSRSGSDLKVHMSTHRDAVERAYRCTVCQKDFKSKKILGMHLRRHEPAKLICEICDKKVFSKYDLRVHRETHSDCKTFTCSHCDKRFSFKNTLVRHVKKHSEGRILLPS